MKSLRLFCLLSALFFSLFANAQPAGITTKEPASYDDVRDQLKEQIDSVNFARSEIVTGKGFNLLMKRRVGNYLTGSSEISLFKTFATYTAENDRLTFGINFSKEDEESGRLVHLFTPLLEAGIKKDFATLYKKDEWQADIRVGFKYSFLLGISTLNFNELGSRNGDKEQLIRIRNAFWKRAEDKLDEEEIKAPEKLLSDAEKNVLDKERKDLFDAKEKIRKNAALDKKAKAAQMAKLDAAFIQLLGQYESQSVDFSEKLNALENDLAKEEADALDKGLYRWLQTYWISVWGFAPVTERSYFVSPDNSQPFQKQRSGIWEFNGQFNALWDHSRGGTVYLAGLLKFFQNNSAMADLMTAVDYEQYSLFPGSNPSNFAKLESNKAFIGTYEEFFTSQLSLHVVYMAPFKQFFNIGVSIRAEKNLGDYDANNWRFGLPLRFAGKDKPINVEPQIRLNNTNNYAGVADYKVKPIFGVNVGLPFGTLFK